MLRATELLTDAMVMLKDIQKARQLPPFASVQNQYIALGKEIELFLATQKEPAMFQLEVKNVGKSPAPVMVFDAQGFRKPAMFETQRDAEEALRMYEYMRTDSAFEWIKII